MNNILCVNVANLPEGWSVQEFVEWKEKNVNIVDIQNG